MRFFVLCVPVLLVLVLIFPKPHHPVQPSVERAAISIKTVHHGAMPLHIRGRGMITQTGTHSGASLMLGREWAAYLTTGSPAFVKVAGVGGALAARVSKIGEVADFVPVEISFSTPLPPEAARGDSADIAIEYGKIENATYLERGSLDPVEVEAWVFHLDANGKSALRGPVRFGAAASEMIEIRSGLREGDRVIVSDMSRWENVDRVLIE